MQTFCLDKAVDVPIDSKLEQWLAWTKAVALCTHQAYRPDSERYLSACYEKAGFKPPSVFVWARSPVVGMFAGSLIANQLEGGRVRNRPASLLKKARLAVDCKFTADVYKVADKALDILSPTKRGVQNANFRIIESAAEKLLWSRLQTSLVSGAMAALDQATSIDERADARPLLNNKVGTTQHWLMRRCLEETLDELSPDSTFTPSLKELSYSWLGGPSVLGQVAYERYFNAPNPSPFAQLVGSCGWVYPHQDFAVLVDRPALIDGDGSKLTFHDLYVYGR